MTTLVPFIFSPTGAPPFQATITLDGTQYALIGIWNAYRGDWYYQIVDQYGNVIITAALIGSPPGYDIYLAPGLFSASTILWRPSTGNFEINP